MRCFGTYDLNPDTAREFAFLYALRREVLRNSRTWWLTRSAGIGFYTPFGVRRFGTTGTRLSRCPRCRRFYTPFGVRRFGTWAVIAFVAFYLFTDPVSIRPSA